MGVTDEDLDTKRGEVEALRVEIAARVENREALAREKDNAIAYQQLDAEHKRLEETLAAMDQDAALVTEGISAPVAEPDSGSTPPPAPPATPPSTPVVPASTPTLSTEGDENKKEGK